MIIGFVKVYRHRGFCYLNPMANSLSFLFSIVYGTLGGRVNPALAIPFLALSTFDPSYTVSSPGGYDVPWPSHIPVFQKILVDVFTAKRYYKGAAAFHLDF